MTGPSEERTPTGVLNPCWNKGRQTSSIVQAQEKPAHGWVGQDALLRRARRTAALHYPQHFPLQWGLRVLSPKWGRVWDTRESPRDTLGFLSMKTKGKTISEEPLRGNTYLHNVGSAMVPQPFQGQVWGSRADRDRIAHRGQQGAGSRQIPSDL